MSSVNKHIILGRLGADPEMRYTQSNTAVVNMSIATSRKYKDSSGRTVEETEWHRVVAWDRRAEVAHEYLRKGDQVYIEGPSKTREWEDKDGIKRYSTEVTALQLVLLGSPRGEGQQNRKKQASRQPARGGNPGGGSQKVSSNVDLNEDFDDIDDDLPF